MKNLHNLGWRGRLPNFIEKIPIWYEFWVGVGSTLWNFSNQLERVPLREYTDGDPTLTKKKINNIFNCLNPGIDDHLYVDDFSFQI